MKKFNPNDFVIDKVFKAFEKCQKKKKKDKEDYYDPREHMRVIDRRVEENDPTSKLLRDPKELYTLLFDEVLVPNVVVRIAES